MHRTIGGPTPTLATAVAAATGDSSQSLSVDGGNSWQYLNLLVNPRSIEVCLATVFPAIPCCLDLIGARRIETYTSVVAAFRSSFQ